MTDITITPEYSYIKKLIEEKTPVIFVTGGAGTGKSTCINWLLEQFYGQALIGAPTAVAAINIGAKTLHSLCLLPPAWIVEEDIQELYGKRRSSVLNAKILIIDEISMVNPNMLDAVDKFFRINRKRNTPFGGLTTVVVGDLLQLPPVVTASTRKLFDRNYDTVNFYGASCFNEIELQMVELQKTFRQTDEEFIDVLSCIRRGVDLQRVLSIINNKCKVTRFPKEGAIRLSPRNAEVNEFNEDALDALPSPLFTYEGEVTGSFRDTAFPAPLELLLKVGAQVVFTQNDATGKWINGTVGVVFALGKDVITVKITDSGNIVEVPKAKWTNYDYAWSDSLHRISRQEIGTYEQYPLMLAWAVTIHKSQGKTIKNVHLALGSGAFETGQTYVALSRCPSMEGITLARTIEEEDIIVDEEIQAFYEKHAVQ
jgi:hypothetical protein